MSLSYLLNKHKRSLTDLENHLREWLFLKWDLADTKEGKNEIMVDIKDCMRERRELKQLIRNCSPR